MAMKTARRGPDEDVNAAATAAGLTLTFNVYIFGRH